MLNAPSCNDSGISTNASVGSMCERGISVSPWKWSMRLQQRRARTQPPATETSHMKGLVTAGLLVAAALALSACGKSGEMTPSSEAPDHAASAQAPAATPPATPPPATPATAPEPAATSAAPPSASTAGSGANPQQ